MKRRLAVGLVVGCIVAGAAIGCGGTSLPEAPPCPTPTPTRPSVGFQNEEIIRYVREVRDGEEMLADLLADFRTLYPEGRFYRSAQFREDWVLYAGAATCRIEHMTALSVPDGAGESLEAGEAELESILADYRNQLAYGTDAVRQRNTSDYRNFNRRVDDVAGRLAAFAGALTN